MDPIQVELEGERGRITADAVQEALRQLLILAKDAANSSPGQAGGAWVVERLELGSAIVAIANPAAPGVPAIIDAGLDALRATAELPRLWTSRMVGAVRKLGRLPGRHGVEAVSISTLGVSRAIDARMATQAESALTTTEISLASVRGRLDTWSSRRGIPQVGMTLADGGVIQVHYSDAMVPLVMPLLDREVEAWGQIERNAAGQRLRLRLEGIELAAPPARMVPVHEVAGLYADLWPGYTASDVMPEVRE